MATTPLTIEQFGGLNLASDPLEVGATRATDMLNVDLDLLGRVKTRAGYTTFTSSPLAGTVASIAAIPVTGYSLAAWGGGTYYVLNNTGGTGSPGSSYNPGANSHIPMFLSGDAFTDVYATTDAVGSGRMVVYDVGGSSWSTMNITASVDFADYWTVIGETPVSHRIVLSGGLSRPGRIVFSDAGGGTWTASSWIEPFTGDGQTTTSVAPYREMFLVFNPIRFAVFYGESVDGDGNPIFNYRMVDTKVGCIARFGTAVAPEGVYFVGRDGIYLTTGDAPRKVSGALDPLFRGTLGPDYSGSAIAQQYLPNAQAVYYRERLYVSVTTGASTTNNRVLVFDPKLDSWMVWDLAARSLATRAPITGGDEELFFGYVSGSNNIGRHFRTYTDDAGSTISWSYKSGRYALADAGRVAITNESSLVGSGTVALRLDSDLYTNQNASATLGTAPAVAEGWPSPVDQEGTWLQHTLSGSGPGSVSRLTHHIQAVKPAGVR